VRFAVEGAGPLDSIASGLVCTQVMLLTSG
jgi:hypothetical protein